MATSKAITFSSIVASWPVISGLCVATITLVWYAAISYGKINDNADEITKLKATHPETIADEVHQHTDDIKAINEKLDKIGGDTSYSRGKLDTLSNRMDDFNRTAAALSERIDKLKGGK